MHLLVVAWSTVHDKIQYAEKTRKGRGEKNKMSKKLEKNIVTLEVFKTKIKALNLDALNLVF